MTPMPRRATAPIGAPWRSSAQRLSRRWPSPRGCGGAGAAGRWRPARPPAIRPRCPLGLPSRQQPAPADLNTLLARLERTMRQRVPRRVAFRLSLLPELWRCRAESPTVRSLVLDLVSAAVAELRGNGELIVGTRNIAIDAHALAETPGAQIGEFARITVRDNGPGLADDALERVFDRTQTSRPSAAAAAETMRHLGGFARVESAEGVGTAIHLYLPRAAAPVEGAIKDGKPAEAAA